uniref:Uncharacterized protein n=1 Tax=Plectus sambesii TaxID=2011161 RepID=A0A914UHS9_9BILA
MVRRSFDYILCSVGALLLVLSFPVEATTTLNSQAIECYANKTDCTKVCKNECYLIDNCNGEPSRYICLPISPTLFIILIVAVCLISALCCCCCVGVIICCAVKIARRRRTTGQVVFDGKSTAIETGRTSSDRPPQ